MGHLIQKGKSLFLMLALVSVAFITGCPPATKTNVTPAKGNESTRLNPSIRYFPSPENPVVIVEKRVPEKARPGEKFNVAIIITNKADYKINKITVSENIPQNFKYIKALPRPLKRETSLKWNLGSLYPGKSKKIIITGQAVDVGTIRYLGETTLNFRVATDNNFASTVNVIEPKLTFTIQNPATALIGEKIPATLTLVNKGDDSVKGAKLVHTLPVGLLTYEGKSKIENDKIGDLPPGARKVLNIDLKGTVEGAYKTKMEVIAEEGVSASAMLCVKITKPVLAITGKAPKKRFVGNKSPYTIKVVNKGDAPAQNTVVKLMLPEGILLSSVSEGGNKSGRVVTWKLNTLQPGETKTLKAMTIVKKIMNARAVAVADAKAAKRVQTAMVTDIAGIAGLLTTLEDTNDPVPLGENEIYVITADNTGSLDATKIKIKCILSDSMEYVKSSGATKGQLNGNVLTFEPLPALNPQARAQWKVIVKALKPGDVRFEVQVESEQLDRPVKIFESTHFYK